MSTSRLANHRSPSIRASIDPTGRSGTEVNSPAGLVINGQFPLAALSGRSKSYVRPQTVAGPVYFRPSGATAEPQFAKGVGFSLLGAVLGAGLVIGGAMAYKRMR